MGYDPKAVKKAVIQILKDEFPDTTFTVRSSSGKILIDWTDGPTEEQVRNFVYEFEDKGHDYSGSYSTSGNALSDNWVDYVRTTRHYSDDALEAAYEEIVLNSNIDQTAPEEVKGVDNSVVVDNFVIKNGGFVYLNDYLFRFGNEWLHTSGVFLATQT